MVDPKDSIGIYYWRIAVGNILKRVHLAVLMVNDPADVWYFLWGFERVETRLPSGSSSEVVCADGPIIIVSISKFRPTRSLPSQRFRGPGERPSPAVILKLPKWPEPRSRILDIPFHRLPQEIYAIYH